MIQIKNCKILPNTTCRATLTLVSIWFYIYILIEQIDNHDYVSDSYFLFLLNVINLEMSSNNNLFLCCCSSEARRKTQNRARFAQPIRKQYRSQLPITRRNLRIRFPHELSIEYKTHSPTFLHIIVAVDPTGGFEADDFDFSEICLKVMVLVPQFLK